MCYSEEFKEMKEATESGFQLCRGAVEGPGGAGLARQKEGHSRQR